MQRFTADGELTPEFKAHLGRQAGRIWDRVKRVHESRGCSNWETWTEYNQPLMGGGRADVTYDGCQKCRVAIARND